jgi:hypothetical protein
MNRYIAFLAGALLVLSPAFAAADLIIGTESSAGGFIGDLVPSIPNTVTVASDGENGFFPFGVTFDTSDGLQNNAANTGSTFTLLPGSAWVPVAGQPQTWVHPAIAENEPGGENPAFFVSDNGLPFTPGILGNYLILEQNGALSDVITLFNNQNGVGTIEFASDPFAMPEPTSLTLLTVGLAGLAARRLRQLRRKPA